MLYLCYIMLCYEMNESGVRISLFDLSRVQLFLVHAKHANNIRKMSRLVTIKLNLFVYQASLLNPGHPPDVQLNQIFVTCCLRD